MNPRFDERGRVVWSTWRRDEPEPPLRSVCCFLGCVGLGMFWAGVALGALGAVR